MKRQLFGSVTVFKVASLSTLWYTVTMMLVGVYLIIVLVVNSWDTHIKYGMFDITSTVINGLKVTLLETNSKHYGDTVTGKLMIMEFNLHILIMSCWLMFSQWGILVGLVMDYQTACWVLMRNQIALQFVSNYEIRAKKMGKIRMMAFILQSTDFQRLLSISLRQNWLELRFLWENNGSIWLKVKN